MNFLRHDERILAVYHYKMFRAGPLWLLLFSLSILYYGVGLIFIILWFTLKVPTPKLYITNQGIIYKEITFKRLDFESIDRIIVRSSLPQKIINAGYLVVHSDGWVSIPWILNGFPDPEAIKKSIHSQMSSK